MPWSTCVARSSTSRISHEVDCTFPGVRIQTPGNVQGVRLHRVVDELAGAGEVRDGEGLVTPDAEVHPRHPPFEIQPLRRGHPQPYDVRVHHPTGSGDGAGGRGGPLPDGSPPGGGHRGHREERESTRLNT